MEIRIIIIDDELDFIESVNRGLITSGFKNVQMESDPLKAVSLFEQGETFDIALIDITMPGMDGIELLEFIKNKSPDTECIMVTAIEEAKAAVECMKKGAYDYICKPITREHLIVTINRALTLRKQIHERLQAEDALHLFKTIIESSNEAIAISDPNGQIVYINPAHEKLFGRSLEEAKQVNYRDYYPDESIDVLNREVAPALERGEGWEGVLDVFDTDGRRFPLWERADTVRDADGKMLYGFGLMHDVSEEKQKEESIRKSEERFRSLFKTMSEGVVLIDPDGQIAKANPAAEHILGLKRSEIESRNYVSPEWDILRSDGTLMPPEEMAGPRVMKEKRPVTDQVMGVRSPDGSISWIEVSATPNLNADGKITGIVGTFADISKRKRAEDELQASEKRFRTSIDNMLDAFAIFSSIRDEAGKIVDFKFEYINEAACQLNQRTREWHLRHTLLDLLPGHIEAGLLDKYVQVVETGEPLREESYVYEDMYGGDQRLVRVLDFNIIKLGDGFISNWRDVCERKKAEERIKESEWNFRLLTELSHEAIVLHKNGQLVFANDQYYRMCGYKPEEMVDIDIITKTLTPESTKVVRERVATGNLDPYEAVAQAKDGRKFPVEIHPNMTEYNGQKVRVAVIRDLTERKRAEDNLKAEKDFTDIMLNTMLDTVFVFEPETGKPLRWNLVFNEVSGYTDEEIAAMKAPDDWYKPEDLEKARVETEKLLRGEKSLIEMSLITKHGRIIPTEYTASMMNDAQGNPKYIIAVGRDITECKRAEEEIKASLKEKKRGVESSMCLTKPTNPDEIASVVDEALSKKQGT